MQHLTTFIAGLRSLAALLEKESAANASFARKLELALAVPGSPTVKAVKKKAKATPKDESAAPGQFDALARRGGDEFRAFLLSLDVPTLKAIIKREGLDPGKSARSWKNADRLAGLIFDRTAARMNRGSAFLPPKAARANKP